MQKLLMFTAILLVLLIQGLLPTELLSAARTFRADLSWSVWRGTNRGSGNIAGTNAALGS